MRNLPRDSESGFTLAEMLIAMMLTLIVLSAAIETLTRTMSMTGTARLISETNHGLQAGTSLMVRDIMQTGQGIPLGGIPLPSGVGADPVYRPGPDGLTFDAGAETVPAISPGNELGPTLLGVATDVITVLYADRTLALDSKPLVTIASNGTSMTVDAAVPVTGSNGLKAGDLILFTNPNGNALQMVTATPTSQVVEFDDNDPMRMNQRSAPQGTLLNLKDAATGTFPQTTALRVFMISYFVDLPDGSDLPRLVRRVNMGDKLAIAMGVENLQVTYDLVDGTTNPTNVQDVPSGNSPNQIRKVNLFVAARSQDVDPQTHEYFRNSMATQVGLRSLSFVDRYR
jgi:prepilin-type N-terminal cleavage/methylation domain-containing protein